MDAARVTSTRSRPGKWIVSERTTNRESPCRAATPCTSGFAARSEIEARPLRKLVSCAMRTRVVVLGAGFGGLELTTILSDAFGDAIDIVLIDKNDTFAFGFSKLDVRFGRRRG